MIQRGIILISDTSFRWMKIPLIISILIVAFFACTFLPGLPFTGLVMAAFSTAPAGNDPHTSFYVESKYPSAVSCKKCHPLQFEQWSVSQHAYTQLSPVFNTLQAAVLYLTNGSFGDFCIRCHTGVGMAINEPLFTENLKRDPVSREGVTCIICHRINKPFGKVAGRRGLITGNSLQPIYGPTDSEETDRVIKSSDEYQVTTNPTGPGRKIHTDAVPFFQILEPGFCASCHDVTLPDGFRLEEAFSEYKHSPANKRYQNGKKGVTCQDCHWGKEPGVDKGYDFGPAAVVGGKPTKKRRLANHMVVGPDYSVIHPALFPHNPDVIELASLENWLTFDYEKGWGTDEFENNVREDMKFPERWSTADDRYEAREIINKQLELLREATERRIELLRNGYQIGELVTERADARGIRFKIQIRNATDGHNVPTGFSAERIVFLRVTVKDNKGKIVLESGNLDPNGDLRDSHSYYVHNGEIPKDKQLFSLQSRFITRSNRGGEREQILPINHSIDPLPFLRPPTYSAVLTGRSEGARLHKMGIEPGGERWATYRIDSDALTGNGPYTADISLIAGMVPVNLVKIISFMGFDYNMSAREIADKVVAGHSVLWTRQMTFNAP